MNSPHLIYSPNSGASYYFRSYIPKDLLKHFGETKGFRISLRCAIKSHAVKTSKRLAIIVSQIYEEIREGMESLDIEQIKEILRVEVKKQLLHAHHIFEGTNRWDDSGIQESLNSIQLKETKFKTTLKSDLKSYQNELDAKLEDILKSLDIKVEKNSVNFKKLRNKFIDLYSLRYDWMRELVNETGKTDNDLKITAQTKLNLELFPELINSPIIENYSIEPKEPYLQTTPQTTAYKSTSGTLSENAKRFFQIKRIEGKRPKGILSDENTIAEFIEIVGDIDFSSLTKREVSNYIDVLTKLPPNRNKTKQLRDLSITELLELNLPQEKCQLPQNVNKKIGKLSVFGNYGVRQGLLMTNPFSMMKFAIRKQGHQREPFNKDDLRKILNTETYLNWTIRFEHRFRDGRATNQMPYFWCFLWGIFSGLRTNEMCQTRCSDIRKEKKIWFMFVEDSEETKVKTQSAIRKVPIHPRLLELGFIEYIANLKRAKIDRVFHELTELRDGYASKVSRHYNEKFLPSVGVWKKHTKVLYCTRHTFINKLYSEKVDENVIKTLVGHEKEFTMKHYGGQPFSPERLLEEISKVDYSGINWKGLKKGMKEREKRTLHNWGLSDSL